MLIYEARRRLALIDAVLAKLEDVRLVSIDIDSSWNGRPRICIVEPDWETFDERRRVDLSHVQYLRNIDGVSVVWYAKEPLPEGA